MKGLLICAGILLVPAAARADPCEGRLPERAGEAFAGIVRYVGDGDSLCVGNTANPAAWIEVRLSDFDAAELHSRPGLDRKGWPVAAGARPSPRAWSAEVESLRDSADAVNQAPDMERKLDSRFRWTHEVGPPQTIKL